MATFSSLLFMTFSLVFLQVNANVAEFAVLRASTKLSKTDKYFCVLYNPKWKELPTELSSTPKYEYELVSIDVLCGGNTSKDSYNDKAVFSKEHPSNPCSYSTMVKYAQERNATELVIINSDDKLFAIAKASQNYKNSTIAVAVMKNSDYHTMKGLGDSVLVQLYAPPIAAIDSNLLVIWFLAFGTVVIGAYWSGKVAIQQRDKLVEKKASSSNEKLVESDDEESPSAQVSPLMVIIFVAMICGFLLLVYYLYKYVVYVIIVIFAIASSTGMYECFNALVMLLPFCTCKVPPNSLPVLNSEPFVKSIFVALFSLSFAVWWFIVRNGSYAWILQDILGVVFCISLLKNLRLPSMKICTLLLVLLLIYDVFFVFITPLFSAGHNSVMVDVATGEGHKEQIPMVIKVPRIMRSALLVCGQRDYSLLGLGDILVPGLFVSFCHCYDQMAKTPYKIYYVASSIAYGCGLFITFAALYLMKEGQPALVYLVPCTLGTVFIISLIRREFLNLWNGTYLSSPPNNSNQELLSDEDEDEDIYQKPDNDQSSIIVGANENLNGERERLIN